MDDFEMIRNLLPEQPPPDPRVVASARARITGQPGLAIDSSRASDHRPRSPAPRRHRHFGVAVTGVAVTGAAAVTAAALVFSLVAGRASGRGPAGHGSHRVTAVALSARQILLAAATHVIRTPSTGRYWYFAWSESDVMAAGTKAHPYDVVQPTTSASWLSKVPGQRDFSISQLRGAAPATVADRAQWLAAGAPTQWKIGLRTLTTRSSAPVGSIWASHGTVGYIEGDLPYWTARQFRSLPDSPAALKAVLLREADQTYSAQHPASGGATANQLLWTEAVQLLQSPVTWQVRAAALRVMAGLPGVQSLGPMRDPLGRVGIGMGGTGSSAQGQITIIDPTNGTLFATEYLSSPGQPNYQACVLRTPHGGKLRVEVPSTRHLKLRHLTCPPVLYGRWTATTPSWWLVLVAEGWANSAPAMPRDTQPNDQGY